MAATFQSTSLSCLLTATGPVFCHQVLVAGEQTQRLFVTLQKPQWTPGRQERFVRLVYNPSIGSELNPFSDRWLVARRFQTEPQSAGPAGGKTKFNPSTDQRKRI